ncbi:MAG: HypC/HybG/HupF family hydrogenase formation chaperone [Ignavibacteriales bacterium]|nr:HypC/HybG/HupF family hydrogenase formation chaperone [Ignavibacteriales bacterium]
MCLAIPGKVLEIDNAVSPIMGKVSFGGIKKEICLELVPEVKIGNYVIVHVGFAISMMDEAEAQETLKLIEQMGELGEKSEARSKKSDARSKT